MNQTAFAIYQDARLAREELVFALQRHGNASPDALHAMMQALAAINKIQDAALAASISKGDL